MIHNLRNIVTLNDSISALNRDLYEVFENLEKKEQVLDEKTSCTYYVSDSFIHFIYAEKDTEAGDYYNMATSKKIIQYINSQDIEQLDISDFYPRLIHAMNKNL